MLRVRLLGTLGVELDGTTVLSSPSQRPWAVFAYLALEGRAVSRSELASRFWPDVLDQSAKASLRSALWALRRELGDRLIVDRERIALAAEEHELWVDVREFERLAADGAPEQALELCRGELLEGVEDEWALSARERHRDRVTELLEQLAQACEDRGEARAAIEWTRREVQHDPFDEEAHRRLIARLNGAGDRAGALRTYRTLAERLRRELAVAPSPRTRELIEQLRMEAPGPSGGSAPTWKPALAPLVGRERELAELERVWRAAADGSGAAALVRGEPGIGKTRLASELRRLVVAGGGTVAVCAALDFGASAPLSLWAELIRELLPSLPAPPGDAAWPDDLAVLTSELPVHFGRGGAEATKVAPDLQRTRLFEAVVALVAWAARDRPLLLVLEDLHVADLPSLELAAYVARRVSVLPVMMLLTRRELPHSADADSLEYSLRSRGLVACDLAVGPLAPSQLAALARRVGRLSPDDVARVVERAEGNALLAMETARSLVRDEGEVAPSLRAMVRATLAPVQGDARALVELAAVASRAVEPVELGHLPLQDPDESAARILETGLLITSEGRLGFRHSLLREAVYEEIAEPRRRGLHRRWVEAVLASEHDGAIPRPAEAAHHLRLAGCDADAVPQLARAAADARAVAALAQAVAYLEEAMAIDPSQAGLCLELAEIEAWRGRREQAETAFERAVALLEGAEPLELARAWLRRARAYHGSICIPRAVLESCRIALELLDQTDRPTARERREALAAQAWAEAVAGSVDAAEQLLAQLGTAPESDLETYDIGHARAHALMRRGLFADSYAPSIAAGEAIGRAGRPDLAAGAWVDAAGAATAAGELERALGFIDRGFGAIDGLGVHVLEFHLLAARSFVLRRLGRARRRTRCGAGRAGAGRAARAAAAARDGEPRPGPRRTRGRRARTRGVVAGRVTPRWCADQPTAYAPGARRGTRPRGEA